MRILPNCGDGVLDPGEECDDGNNDDGDGCDADCTTEVILAVMRVTSLPESRERLYQDDKFKVVFDGWGYTVYRKSDGQKMSDSLVNAALAQQAILNLYAKRVA